MLTSLIIASSALACLVGGVFYAFSTFVMRALYDQPAAAGVAAMQRINITVINPLFLGPFLGTTGLLAVAALVARSAGNTESFVWLVASFLLYAVGSVGVTLRFNVPRNNKLAALSSASDTATAYWPIYVREWTFWNHVRTAACLAAGVAAIVALPVAGSV